MTDGFKHAVGPAEMKISRFEADTLLAYALGSCLGIAIYDPVARVGGLLHVMLPTALQHGTAAHIRPFMFVDTGVPLLFRASYAVGARKENLVVSVVGGASVRGSEALDAFRIGPKNVLMLQRLFAKNRITMNAYDVGGHHARTISLRIATGEVGLKADGRMVWPAGQETSIRDGIHHDAAKWSGT